MSIVTHGKVRIYWCHNCDVPIVRQKHCPACGRQVKRIDHTPPGDMRPAFLHDIEEIRSLADSQWGSGAGMALLPSEGPYLINPSPAKDRMDEVIRSGSSIGAAVFDLEDLKERLLLRDSGGMILQGSGFKPTKGFVIADPGALDPLLGGANLLSPGILSASDDILPGDEVLIMVEGIGIIGSGPSRKKGSELANTRGLGIKIRWCKVMQSPPPIPPVRSWKEAWDLVQNVNSKAISEITSASVSFVRRVVREMDLPVAVSFSGGKDSLATLLLVMDAGFKPPVLFVDTGIEFPETVRHVHESISSLGLELNVEGPTSPFIEDARTFGPPGRDYRWCCKTCKLGPMTRLINEKYPKGVLTFIGQRRYESDARERKGNVWKNPWVPGQIGASPVQEWTALDIWLYILVKGVNYNPLYEKGFNRIGCFLCPSIDLHERELTRSTELDGSAWIAFLEEWRVKNGLPKEWATYGFHRFKRSPPYMKQLQQKLALDLTSSSSGGGDEPVLFVDGHKSCDTGISREGVLASTIPYDRFKELANILGSVRIMDGVEGFDLIPNGWDWKKSAVESFKDGAIVVRGHQEPELEVRCTNIRSIVLRAAFCVGCGVCAGRCPAQALSVKDKRISLDPNKCMHCHACLGPCPAETFRTPSMIDPMSDGRTIEPE